MSSLLIWRGRRNEGRWNTGDNEKMANCVISTALMFLECILYERKNQVNLLRDQQANRPLTLLLRSSLECDLMRKATKLSDPQITLNFIPLWVLAQM